MTIDECRKLETGTPVWIGKVRYDFGYISAVADTVVIYYEGERNMQDSLAVDPAQLSLREEVILCGGKYVFRIDERGVLLCLRHGEPWREFIGDNAILALFLKRTAEWDQKHGGQIA